MTFDGEALINGSEKRNQAEPDRVTWAGISKEPISWGEIARVVGGLILGPSVVIIGVIIVVGAKVSLG